MSKEDGEAVSSSVRVASSIATSQAGDQNEEKSRRPVKGVKPYEASKREEMEKCLSELNGCLGLSFSCLTNVKRLKDLSKSSILLNFS